MGNKEEILNRYNWTLYNTEESLKCELMDLKENWQQTYSGSYHRGRANTLKDIMFDLTDDEKWNQTLDELKSIYENES